MKALTHLIAGALFGLGLFAAGMTDPDRVKAFLYFGSDWDPSLAITMLAAIAVHAPAYRFLKRRNTPYLSDTFRIPGKNDVDLRLFSGAALFGLGWGWSGYCPGPAMTSVSTLSPATLVYVFSMLFGMALHKALTLGFSRQKSTTNLEEGI